jgi:ubiquinone/menaquinone biosynthesis C-methylase UbiE
MTVQQAAALYHGRKLAAYQAAEQVAPERDRWIERNAFYYHQDLAYMRFLIDEGQSVLDIGCGTGRLLQGLRPSRGVGIDFSPAMLEIARRNAPELEFYLGDAEDASFYDSLGGPFDVIVLSDTIGSLTDCQAVLSHLHRVCTPATRVIIAYYSSAWAPILACAKVLGLQMPQPRQNWLSSDDIANLLYLADFDTIKREWRQLLPRRLLGIGSLINRYIAPLPGIRRACLRDYLVARVRPTSEPQPRSVSVVIPCRNERGNIEAAIRRLPSFGTDMEIIFIEGHSSDGTLEEIERVTAAYPELDIKAEVQDGKGKGDAVRKGFDMARGEMLMILDADLTTPPEDLPKFYQALVTGKGEFINGSRLVYPMERQAMQFLNLIANTIFSWLFSWLLNQRFTDTLCGTKVLLKTHYQQIAANRAYFGEFDPFGDFDLIFGAAKLNLKVAEIPVSYASRDYGQTNISRFRHGLLLLRMVWFAFFKFKSIK